MLFIIIFQILKILKSFSAKTLYHKSFTIKALLSTTLPKGHIIFWPYANTD